MLSKLIFLFVFIFSASVNAQKINYSYFLTSTENLKNHLSKTNDYFIGKYQGNISYQGKSGDLDIVFYNTISEYIIFRFSNSKDYHDLLNEIKSKAFFYYKFCSDYNHPIVYNFLTNNDHKIRFNLEEYQISLEYPSDILGLLNENSEILTPVFTCNTDYSYAFHTNIKCEGLNNCKGKIYKTNIKNAKKDGYKLCHICSSF